jgi:hypothetical protein
MNYNTIIAGDFNAPLSILDSSFRQRMNEEALDLNFTLGNEPNRYLQNIPSSNMSTYTFSSNAHEIFPKDHMLGNRTSLRRLRSYLVSFQ